MVKRMLYFIFVLCLIALLPGCWDKDELNELGIMLALGIDMEGDLYKVSAQVVLPTEIASKGGGEGNSVTLFEATGPSLNEALRKITETSPRVMYIPQLRVVVLGEDYARRGISNMVEDLVRDVFARADYFVLVAKGRQASDVLQVATPLEKIPANQLFSSLLASSKSWAPATTVTIDELMKQLVSDSVHPVLTGVDIVERGSDEGKDSIDHLKSIRPKAELRVTSLAVFKKDKMIGWLNEEHSKGYNYIQDKVNQTFGHIKFKEGLVSLRILRSSTDKKVKIVDGEPLIKLKVTNINTVVGVSDSDVSLKKQEDIHIIEQKSVGKINEILKSTVETVQKKFKVDIFGFGELIHQSHPKLWDKLKDHWDEEFPKLQVEYSAEVQIRRVGQLSDTYLEKMRENK